MRETTLETLDHAGLAAAFTNVYQIGSSRSWWMRRGRGRINRGE
ncbi:MAG: hypothetical protein U0232_26765 [Thermomicrobiales bacterium]